MAPGATLHRFEIALSHVDRGIYETLALRVARHPSETMAYLLARVLAYAFLLEEGIEFSKGGLSDADAPALSIRTLDGRLMAWIDVGAPSAERLHKASKASPRVVVVTHRNPQLLLGALAGQTIHRRNALEIYAVGEALVKALEPLVAKSNDWAITFTEGSVYVTAGTHSIDGAFERISLEA